jgi:hypothetical protein
VTRADDLFALVKEVAALMADFPRPWFIVGGWAIDLFVGHVTRDHEDVDVGILRRDQRALRGFFAGWDFEKVEEARRAPWPQAEQLNLPVQEVHARRLDGAPRQIEFLLNEARDDAWVFRRDARIERPLSKARQVTRSGIPYLDPAIVLLFKAKDPKPKDVADFELVRSDLGVSRRLWLRGALEMCHPGHPWIARL